MKNEHVVIAILLAMVAMLLMRSADAQPRVSGPVEPTLVNGVVYQIGSGNVEVHRFWSDGTVDYARANSLVNCDPVISCSGILLSPTCAADISRNGEVAFDDILPVLESWGPCEGGGS